VKARKYENSSVVLSHDQRAPAVAAVAVELVGLRSCHLVIDYPKVPELIPCEIPTCEACPGCDECLDRPYYQYETPCYSNGPANGCVSVEKPECPGWC